MMNEVFKNCYDSTNTALRINVVTGSSGSTQYTEDAVSAGAESLTLAGAVRQDTISSSVSLDGDYGTLKINSVGRLYTSATIDAALPAGTNVIGHAIIDTGSTTAVTQATGSNLHMVVDSGTVTTVSTVTTITNVVHVDDNSSSLTVDNAGTFAVQIAANSSVNVAQINGVTTLMGNGVTGTGSQRVTIASDNTAFSVNATLSAETTKVIGTINIASAQTLATVTTVSTLTGGGVAHDGADSGNPIKVGGRAVSAEITAVANNDRTDFLTDLVGKLIVLPYANPENFVSGAITTAMTGTTTTSLIAAPAAGLRNYITTIICSNAHATVGTDIVIQDGSGGTTLLTIPAAAVYGGAVVTLPTPLRQPTTATAIFCANVTTGASTKVSAVGYKGA